MQTSTHKNIKIIFSLFLPLLLVFYLLYQSKDELLLVFSQPDLSFFFPLLILMQIITILMSNQIFVISLKKMGVKCSFTELLKINLASKFIESVTPSSKLGGEATTFYLLKKKTHLSNAQITSQIMLQKYVLFVPFALICLITLLTSSISTYLPHLIFTTILFVLGLIIPVVVLLAFSYCKNQHKTPLIKKTTSYLFKIQSFLKNIKSNLVLFFDYTTIVKLLLISTLVWLIYPFKVYIATLMTGYRLPFVHIIVATYSAYLISILPLAPGGLGVFETTMAAVLSFYGMPFNQGIVVSFTARLATFWFPLLLSSIASSLLMLESKSNTHNQNLIEVNTDDENNVTEFA